jgi:hypothetical protein
MQQNHNKNGVAVGFQKIFFENRAQNPQAAQKTGCSFYGRMFTS